MHLVIILVAIYFYLLLSENHQSIPQKISSQYAPDDIEKNANLK